MSLLPVYEAQRRVVASEYLHLSKEKQDYWALLVLASQNAFDVMCAVEDGEINAP